MEADQARAEGTSGGTSGPRAPLGRCTAITHCAMSVRGSVRRRGGRRRVSRDVFGHLLALDHSFHVKRKTGQIMRILDRGAPPLRCWATV